MIDNEAVVQAADRVAELLIGQGLTIDDVMKQQIAARIAGFSSLEAYTRHENGARRFRVFPVNLDDYPTPGNLVPNKTHMMPCSPKWQCGDLEVAKEMAGDMAAELSWPVVIVDGNGALRGADEGPCGSSYDVVRPCGKIHNLSAEFADRDAAEDFDVLQGRLPSLGLAAGTANYTAIAIGKDSHRYREGGAHVLWLVDSRSKRVLWRFPIQQLFI